MKQGVTLLTARGWMDGHVIEVRASLIAPMQRIWQWDMTSLTTDEPLAHGRFTGGPRRMANEILNLVEGANDDIDEGCAS